MTELEERTRSILGDYASKLETLGSPDAIALHLQGKQVRAFCGSPQKCAIAEDLLVYLAENGIAPHSVYVGGDITIYLEAFDYSDDSDIRVPNPDVVDQFIEKFDAGHYQDLIHVDDLKGRRSASNYAREKQEEEELGY
jgi:hypothetical protein